MNTLNFKPQVFRIATNGTDGNTFVWDLLTIDGESPNNTVYFFLKGDAPSWQQSSKIIEAIDNESWDLITFENSGMEISDFYIDKSIFETAGEGYSEILKELNP